MLRNSVASDSESFKPSSIELMFEGTGVKTALHSVLPKSCNSAKSWNINQIKIMTF